MELDVLDMVQKNEMLLPETNTMMESENILLFKGNDVEMRRWEVERTVFLGWACVNPEINKCKEEYIKKLIEFFPYWLIMKILIKAYKFFE